MAKVIGVDNHGRDYNGGKDEIVAATGLSPEAAVAKCFELNADANDYSPTWYIVKPDDYVPYKFTGY